MKWNELADKETLDRTVKALRGRDFEVAVAKNGAEAKERIKELVPEGSNVYQISSTTLDQIGFTKELEEGRRYASAKVKIEAIGDHEERQRARKGLTPDYVVGSVQAVTEEGQLLVASASGSQIPPYSFTASHVVLVIGTQKVVKDLAEGMKRIYEHALMLESGRVRKAYGMPSSVVNMVLVLEKGMQGRISVIFVEESLGF
jgi:L-lactate utilization protein LutC